MENYERFCSAVEAAEKIVNEWSDDEDIFGYEVEVDIFVLPPEKIDSLNGNEDINEDELESQGLQNDFCGNIQIQTNHTDADSANDDVNSTEEQSLSRKTDQPNTDVPDGSSDANEKQKNFIGLSEKIGNEKNKVTTWKSTVPIRNQLLKTVKDSKNTIIEELAISSF